MILHENILAKMSPEDRRKLGKGNETRSEINAKIIVKSERELQSLIANWLRLHGYYFDHDSMAKKRVGTLGAPDFQFPYKSRFVAWEVKFGPGSLRPDQAKVRDQIIAQGGEWRIIRSLHEAQEHLREIDRRAGE